MAELDVLLILAPTAMAAISLLVSILINSRKADASQFQDLQRRLAHLEGRQYERDNKGAV